MFLHILISGEGGGLDRTWGRLDRRKGDGTERKGGRKDRKGNKRGGRVNEGQEVLRIGMEGDRREWKGRN